MTQPAHRHNCGRCVFLGIYLVEEMGMTDLYFCSNEYGGSILSRWGSNPPEYWSMPVCVVGDVRMHAFGGWFEQMGLQEGLLLARARGLVPGV